MPTGKEAMAGNRERVEDFRKAAHKMVDFLADCSLLTEDLPVRSQQQPGYLLTLLPETAPEDPEPLENILSDIEKKVLPGITHWQSPNFFAYFPSNGSTPGFLGEMVSAAFNVIGFSWVGSPACTELEMIVMDWLADLMDLPPQFSFKKSGGVGGGVIQGSASEATLVALLAARAKILSADEANGNVANGMAVSMASRLVAYTSDQAHSSVHKACMIAGIEKENFRALPTDKSSNWALRQDVLLKAIEEDKKNGKIPFFLCATIGSTSSTAVDNVALLAPTANKHGLWIHVDAAYAGPAACCPEFRKYFNGLDLCDSYEFNAHKWMLTNFDCGCMWVKESKYLKDALSLSPEYLRNKDLPVNASEDREADFH